MTSTGHPATTQYRTTRRRLLRGVSLAGVAGVGGVAGLGTAAAVDPTAMWVQTARLTPGQGGLFGAAVDVSGTTAVVTSRGEGAAHVYRNAGGGWVREARLLPTGAATHFGWATAVDGDTALVSDVTGTAPNGVRSGTVAVFTRSAGGWSRSATLAPATPAFGMQFGFAVALDGDTAVVGANSGMAPGVAYVFTRTGGGWRQTATLTAAGTTASHEFGHSVAVDGGTAVVGAPFSDAVTGFRTGAAYVFERGSTGAWGSPTRIAPSDLSPGAQFGRSVAVRDGTVVVGAPSADAPTVFTCGAAYVYGRSGGGWARRATLLDRAGAQMDGFGQSVAVAPGVVAVGAVGVDTAAGANAGAVCVFEGSGSTWTQTSTCTARDGAARSALGNAVALDGSVGVFGARSHAGFTGAAYVFARPAA